MLLRAQRRTAEKNLEGLAGNHSNHSMLYLSKDNVAFNIVQLGVKTQSSAIDLLCESVHAPNTPGHSRAFC